MGKKKSKSEKMGKAAGARPVSPQGIGGLCDIQYDMMRKHPYLTLAFYCALFGLSTGCKPQNANLLIIPAVLLTAAGGTVMLRGCFSLNRRNTLLCAAAALVSIGAVCSVISFIDIGFQIVRAVVEIAFAAVAVLLYRKKKLDPLSLLIVVFVLGITLRVLCLMDLGVRGDQHDVGSFSTSADDVFTYYDGIKLGAFDDHSGHAAYIEYIFHYHKLPDFDMRNVWSFYNPPFMHIVSAVWLGAATLFFDYPAACESIQTISLFSSCAVLILSVRLFRQLGLKGYGLVMAFLVVSTSNALIQFSINVNNDPLAAALSLGALVCALDWYRSRRMTDILKTALALGFAMMAKLSAATAAFPIAFLFAAALVSALRKKEKIGRYFAQIGSFLAVCAPLGLFYQVRNLIRFGIPLSYVQTVDEYSPNQYVGNYSLIQRLFGVEPNVLSPPWVHSLKSLEQIAHDGDEYNPLIMLIKTMLYEEYRHNLLNAPGFDLIAAVIFVITLLLGAASLVKMMSKIVRSPSKERIYHLFSAVAVFSMLISYYAFCLKYPYSCSQHIRYIPLIIVFCGAYIGYLYDEYGISPAVCLKNPKKLTRSQFLKSAVGLLTAAAVIVNAYGQLLIF